MIRCLIIFHTGAKKPEKKVESTHKKRRTEEPSVIDLLESIVGNDENDENEVEYMYIGDSDEDSDSDSESED